MERWPLMENNITSEDVLALHAFLDGSADRFTNGPQVRAFEDEFAAWLGVKYAVMVNSGSSANMLTMLALRLLKGPGQVLVPCITWVSDIAAVVQAGLEPIFVDVHPTNISMDYRFALTKAPLATFLTHCLGFPATDYFHRCPGWLIEDVCESLGAHYNGRKLGTFGLMSNFSFYYAHHMSTIEGGMICTDDEECYQTLRRLRSHGLVREMTDAGLKKSWAAAHPDLDPQFIFTDLAYNVRPTELNAVIGRSQLKRVDAMNERRTENLLYFLSLLDPEKYRTNYRTEGSCSYALPLILARPDGKLMSSVIALLTLLGVEYRKGTAGGGNQLRQPYAKRLWGDNFHTRFPEAEHIHNYGLYVGNYPSLPLERIERLCNELNKL